jgi:SAM-dependent methyltransferase
MTQRLYWLGNSAKSRVIDEIIKIKPGPEPVTIFDYGCGDGGDWPSILAEHANLRLIGYEPYAPSYRKARERLRNHAADILTGDNIGAIPVKADYIVSFSVFEHVVHRSEFLRNAKRILAEKGIFYLNYDDGHFRNFLDVSRPATWLPALRAWGRTAVSRPFAALGLQTHYQRRVIAEDVDQLVVESGFHIDRVDYHNLLCLKELSKAMPASLQQRYVAWWLDAEKTLNEQFSSDLAEEQLGDRCNLWQQMLSRTLRLRHD